MGIFDVYLAVDWSARNAPSPTQPSRDAIWVAESGVGETYWRTRHDCITHLRERLSFHMREQRRILIGFDFAFGYPAGFAEALELAGDAPPWQRTWDELSRLVTDDAINANNRFSVAAQLNERCGGTLHGPFWGIPAGATVPWLTPTSPAYPFATRSGKQLQRLRQTERLARGVQPVWKLYGTASVGGQTIMGIPAVCQLRNDPEFAAVSSVWPFEIGTTERPAIVLAEIWPSLAPGIDTSFDIRDKAQVRAMVAWLISLDQAGQLNNFLQEPIRLSAEARADCLSEEGWILGVGRSLA